MSGLLTVDGDRFLRDGRPHRILSGALHYFRVHPDLWEDRLLRLRAMGLNTVETYVAWNVHERRRGEVDFTGWQDLSRFLRIAGECALDVVLRPGPYICAEWDFGGFPAWLLADGVLPGGPRTLRTSDPAYLSVVDAWFDRLLPEVLPSLATRGGPVIAVQVENEYGSFGDDHAYLEHLREGLRRRGVDVLLLTSDGPSADMLASGTLPGALPTANFGARVADAFRELRRAQPVGPLMCMEFWNGWFDHWGEQHHTRSATDAARTLEEVLAAGAGVNLYMAHGGTNFGLWSGANEHDGQHQPTVTSYDYDAAVSESGELTEKFHAFREVLGRYAEPPDLPAPEPRPRLAPGEVVPGAWAPFLPLALAAPGRSGPAPLTFEELGLDHGLVLHSGEVLVPPEGGELQVEGLRDRAVVLADGQVLGTLSRNAPQETLRLAPRADGRPTRLEVLVENHGRINYGPQLGERKGILGGIRLGRRWIHGWTSRPLLLDAPPDGSDASGTTAGSAAAWSAESPDPSTGPVLAHLDLTVEQPADAFLGLPGWDKGFLWLNGFLLGRYWDLGPQRRLYAPAPLWRPGRNDLVVLELHAPGAHLEVRDRPDLG